MRFYPAYTLQSIFTMRAKQFFVLNKHIGTLMYEEEARALSIHHNGKPDVRLREIISELNASRKIKTVAESAIGLIARGEATSVASADLDAERERQKANWEEMKKDRAGWILKQQQKRENPNAT
jgi:hypothetical protein